MAHSVVACGGRSQSKPFVTQGKVQKVKWKILLPQPQVRPSIFMRPRTHRSNGRMEKTMVRKSRSKTAPKTICLNLKRCNLCDGPWISFSVCVYWEKVKCTIIPDSKIFQTGAKVEKGSFCVTVTACHITIYSMKNPELSSGDKSTFTSVSIVVYLMPSKHAN